MSIKEWFRSKKPITELAVKKTFAEKVKDTVVETATRAVSAIPGGIVTLIAIILTTLAFIMGHLLAMAAISGIVMSVSISCIYLNAPAKFKEIILMLCAKFGWYIDIAVTTTLTLMGFHLGATLGIVAMVVGLHVSMMVAIAGWYYSRRTVPTEKSVSINVVKFA